MPRFALAAVFCASFVMSVHARGKDEGRGVESPRSFSVLAPAFAKQGDGLTVSIEGYDSGSTRPFYVALAEDGLSARQAPAPTAALAPIRTVGSARAFALGQRMIALLPVPLNLEPKVYRIIVYEGDAPTGALLSDTPCSIEKIEAPTDTVWLDTATAAIKKDVGPERLAQIRELSELVSAVREEAPRFTGPFTHPVSSTRRTSAFAERRTYRYADGSSESTTHLGIDFGVPTGTNVFASGDGIIVLAKSRISTGLTVVIEHLPGVYSLYYHLDALTCDAGESVRAGTLIGRSGSTGLSTGPHLHWEIRVQGLPVNPDWLVGAMALMTH
jgi:murein DD-endopeptidase MepM/ murein hydrolase activator NlpD